MTTRSTPAVTRREADVLAAVAERLTNVEIAERLYISERTVESHVSALLRKLGAANRVELAVQAKARLAGVGAGSLPGALELLADPPRHVGRRAELDVLRSLWGRAAGGRVLVAVIVGEAGIGKSRLVAELGARGQWRGRQGRPRILLRGRGRPVPAVPPGPRGRGGRRRRSCRRSAGRVGGGRADALRHRRHPLGDGDDADDLAAVGALATAGPRCYWSPLPATPRPTSARRLRPWWASSAASPR